MSKNDVNTLQLSRLLEVIERLRDPETGCPWDQQQNFESIVPHTIEETYEVADAIFSGDMLDIKDELGDLIEEYNRLIKKVEESAEKLAHQEREGAWREMAKQVAHEIKNPLTPMKLSIQYLLHAYRSNPEDISPLLKRVSVTLIEQIDNLASIASEFSNFAKMPRADNQKLVVNDLVKSVFDFFNEGSELIDLSLEY